MSTVVETREVVERDICPQCGHTAGWHGENHDDGCNATGDCHCGLNARDCYASINKSAAIDALIAAVRAEERARCVAELRKVPSLTLGVQHAIHIVTGGPHE